MSKKDHIPTENERKFISRKGRMKDGDILKGKIWVKHKDIWIKCQDGHSTFGGPLSYMEKIFPPASFFGTDSFF